MTQDDIIEMAKEAGFDIGEIEHSGGIFNPYTDDEWRINKELEAFAKLVAAKEREACAKVCEEHGKVWAERFLLGFQATLDDAADAIRARGEQT